MTADEIRKLTLSDPHGSLSETKSHMEFTILREIAAQLAEQTAALNKHYEFIEKNWNVKPEIKIILRDKGGSAEEI
jgi:hypothetical protein